MKWSKVWWEVARLIRFLRVSDRDVSRSQFREGRMENRRKDLPTYTIHLAASVPEGATGMSDGLGRAADTGSHRGLHRGKQ